jgi:hypothetical protein
VEQPLFGVAGDLDATADLDVATFLLVDDQQADPRFARHVPRLQPSLDGAEHHRVAVTLDEDHRRLRAPVGVRRREHGEVRPVEHLARGRIERYVHASIDQARPEKESVN